MAMKAFCPLCRQTIGVTNDTRFHKHYDKEGSKCSGSGRTYSQANKIYNDRLQRRDLWEGFC